MLIESLHLMTSARLALISMDATLQGAATALSNPQIGLLVVCNRNRKAAGVVSKSDIVRHLTKSGVTDAPVFTLMSSRIVACRPEDDLYATWNKMSVQNLQNLPVLDDDCVPLGVLDIRDALKVLFEHEKYEERLLSNYVAGLGYQ